MIESWEQIDYLNPYMEGDIVYWKQGIYRCTHNRVYHSPGEHPHGWLITSGTDNRVFKATYQSINSKKINHMQKIINETYVSEDKIVAPEDWDEF